MLMLLPPHSSGASPPISPLPPLQQRAPATCHLPPCLPHVMICCSRPVLEGAPRLLPGATMHRSFKVFLLPRRVGLAYSDR